ncbi:hypothetical protein GCM10011415_06600 [Salipiger pallidus]|uniref:Uncharacterized protein n=1 Tax=Salipiger pallidus TaxID=1775170 RepID=A0A8J2ZHF3_9RHOB|nr:hypothetical protein [Salipiger pallidus]GGG62879.1 hypothetical protein GCM10011415_06600 [Salipiger pallidus]
MIPDFRDDPDYPAFMDAVCRNDMDAIEVLVAKHRQSAEIAAREGDYEELKTLLLRNKPLNDGERGFLVELLEGGMKPSKGRPPAIEITKLIAVEFYWLTNVDEMTRQQALGYLEERVGRKERTIEERLNRAKFLESIRYRLSGYDLLKGRASATVLAHFRAQDRAEFDKHFR